MYPRGPLYLYLRTSHPIYPTPDILFPGHRVSTGTPSPSSHAILAWAPKYDTQWLELWGRFVATWFLFTDVRHWYGYSGIGRQFRSGVVWEIWKNMRLVWPTGSLRLTSILRQTFMNTVVRITQERSPMETVRGQNGTKCLFNSLPLGPFIVHRHLRSPIAAMYLSPRLP